jgi:serine/threonine protein kinase
VCVHLHRDVSLENVVLSWDGDAHLVDLGSSSMEGSEPGPFRGKLGYCPPEGCALEWAGRFPADVW